jgi:RNA polymerase sigma factor (sigma-70 family)
MTEKEAIEQIQRGEQAALEWVYLNNKDKVIAWLLKEGVNKENATDICHDVFIIFSDNVRRGKYTYQGNAVSTYLIEIAKYKHRDMDRLQHKQTKLEEVLIKAAQEDDALSALLKEQYIQKVEAAMATIGEPCYSLLWLSIVEKKSYEEIIEIIPKNPDAQPFEPRYKDTDTAKNQRHRCLKRLIKLINQSDNPTDT